MTNTINPSIHPDIAMLYNHGFSMVDVTPGRKGGGGHDWVEYQKRRPTVDEINEWFHNSANQKRGERRNVLVICGAVSNLIGVDCDSIEASVWFEAVLREAGFNLAMVPTVETPSGNRHYYLSLGGRTDVAGFKVQLNGVPCIDVQANGRGLAAPPSIFVASSEELAKGKKSGDYRWLASRRLDDLGGMPTMSDEILATLMEHSVGSAPGKEVEKVSTAEPMPRVWHERRLEAAQRAVDERWPAYASDVRWSDPLFGTDDDLYRLTGDLAKVGVISNLLDDAEEYTVDWLVGAMLGWNAQLNGGVNGPSALGPHPDSTVTSKAQGAWVRALEDCPPLGPDVAPVDRLAHLRTPGLVPSNPSIPDSVAAIETQTVARNRAGSGLLSQPMGDGSEVLTVEYWKPGRDGEPGQDVVVPVANFGVRVAAMAYDPDTKSNSYYCQFKSDVKGDKMYLIPPEVYESSRLLFPWLSRRGGFILEQNLPPKAHGVGNIQQRFAAFLHEHTGLTKMNVQDHYGRVSGSDPEDLAVLTDVGVWTPDGLLSHAEAGIIPMESVMVDGAYHYGDGDPDVAVELLRKISTLKTREQEAAVTLSWLLMTQVHEFLPKKHKPMLVVVGESDAGKTTGLNDLATRLIGGLRDATGSMTKASCRDKVASNAIGTVWLDEADDFENLMPIALGASAGSSESKKGPDGSTITVHLRGNIMTTSEVMPDDLRATSGQNRTIVNTYVKDSPEQEAAWPIDTYEDLMDMADQLPDYAGSILMLCLRWFRDNDGRQVYKQMSELTPNPTSRYGMNLVHLRMGARMLSDLLDDPKWLRIVGDYCDGLSTSSVTPQFQQMLTTVINDGKYVTDHKDFHDAGVAVIIDDDGTIWIDPKGLESSWGTTYQGRRSSEARKNKGGIEAITYELCSVLGVPKLSRSDEYARQFYVYKRDPDQFNRLARDGNSRQTFYRLPSDVCSAILADTSLVVGEEEVEGLF